MSENTGPAQGEDNTTSTTSTTSTEDQTSSAETSESTESETDWVAEARKWEQRAKSNSAAAKKLAELEAANRTDTERITALEAELAESKAAALRAQAAAEAEVPVALITASSEEEIKAQVKALKEWLGDKKPGGNHVPREGRQTKPPKTDDKKAFADFLTGQG